MITFTDAWGGYWARFFPHRGRPARGPETGHPRAQHPRRRHSLALGAEYYYNDVNVIIPDELQPQLAAVTSIYTEYANEIVAACAPWMTLPRWWRSSTPPAVTR